MAVWETGLDAVALLVMQLSLHLIEFVDCSSLDLIGYSPGRILTAIIRLLMPEFQLELQHPDSRPSNGAGLWDYRNGRAHAQNSAMVTTSEMVVV